MKKQFFRFKQLCEKSMFDRRQNELDSISPSSNQVHFYVDRTWISHFSRASQTEVLTDDLQAADKHVERIINALNGLSKRLEAELSASEDGLIGFVLKKCGNALFSLNYKSIEHEAKVEQFLTSPIQKILETDVPNIIKHKKNLDELSRHMDSARTKYLQACENSAEEVHSLREELEKAETNVEQCRDQWAVEMFQLMSKETEFARKIIDYVKLQEAYYESALHCFKEVISELECYINNEIKPVYGCALDDHLRVTNRKIALPIQTCVSALLKLGLEEEGLFRLAGRTSELRRFKLSLDTRSLNLPTTFIYDDPHVISGALKLYLRELPEPLLDSRLSNEWLMAASEITSDTKCEALLEVLQQLPQSNFNNLRYLVKFLSKVTENSDVNKMSPKNIAIVIAPNLIWASNEDTNDTVMDMSRLTNFTSIVEQLVTYADWFFPGEIDFDRDSEIGIINGSDNSMRGDLRRCVSSGSLSDVDESLSQGSPNCTTDKNERKIEVNTELTTQCDLQAVVERIKNALTGLSKRLGAELSQTAVQDPAHKDQQLEESSEYALVEQTMLESGLIGFVLKECGNALFSLTYKSIEHEAEVEQFLTTPLQQILETDVPIIVKHKKNLVKLTRDMDSARTKYLQACENSAGGSRAIERLQKQLEKVETEVEQCHDQCAAEMFQLMSKETEFAQKIIEYVKLQGAYYESALHCFNEVISELEFHISDNEMKPVYGYPLDDHLRVTDRKIALPIQLCVSALIKQGLEEEALFVKTGNTSKLRRFKLSLDACCLKLPTAFDYNDPHVVADALKSYLRELPDPLLDSRLYNEWIMAASEITSDTKCEALSEVLQQLPQSNFNNLRYLIKFLSKVTENSDVNKMSPKNIAIVIAPNLIWASNEDTNDMVMDMSALKNFTSIVEQLVTYADWFFPGEIDSDCDSKLEITK